MQKTLRIILPIFLIVFGGLSVFLTTSVILDLFGIREKEGNYVLFIVYTNLICGIIYLYSAYLQIMKRFLLARNLLIVAGLILVVGFLGLLIYVQNGGIHEPKTIKAMVFRIVFTALLSGLTGWIHKNNFHKNTNK